MSLAGILLGIINIAIVVAILLLVGAIILWFMSWMGLAVPATVQKGYIVVVALIGLYMLVALLLGIPSFRVIGFHGYAIPGAVTAAETA
jgi:hypothetical protein